MSLTVLQVAYPLAPAGLDAVGGAEQVLSHLDRALVAAGHRSLVIACAGSKVAGTLIETPAISGPITEQARAQAQAAHRRAIQEALARWPVDVVHLHGLDFDAYLPPPGPAVLVTLHLPPDWYAPGALHPQRPRTWLHCVSAAQARACPSDAPLLPMIGRTMRGPMLCKAAVGLVLALAPASVFAQTSFQGVTPGTSTRADVERAFGSETGSGGGAVEYRAPEGIQKVTVRYGPPVVSGNPPVAQSRLAIVEAIDVILIQPVTRRALAERFGVGSGTTRTVAGRLVEYFDAPALLSFNYAAADPESGVSSVTHFSARAFPAGKPIQAAQTRSAPGLVIHEPARDRAQANSHAIAIIDALVVPRDRGPSLVLTATDAAGDISANRRTEPMSEVQFSFDCPAAAGTGFELIEGAERKDGGTIVVTVKAPPRALGEGCRLRVRLKDDADNLSEWFAVKTAGR